MLLRTRQEELRRAKDLGQYRIQNPRYKRNRNIKYRLEYRKSRIEIL
jgi:hypothetical protein